MFRRFELIRWEDVSGVSGVGLVALGVEFPDGSCAVRWLGETPTTTVYNGIADVEHIHTHGGKTELRWVD